MGELAALLPHRTGGMPSYAYDSFEPLGHTTAKHIGGVSGWGYWLGWFPVAPINMLLAAGYIAVLFHVPLGRSFSPLGTLGSPVSMGVLVITFVGLIGLFIPCYLGIRLGARFATILGVTSMVPLDAVDHPPHLQAVQFPLVEHLGLPLRQSSHVGDDLLHGLDLRDLLERHRHGGGGVLHR